MSGGGGNGSAAAPTHVVMFPWLAFGHISPFAQLTRRLVSGSGGDGSFRVMFLTVAGNVAHVEAMLAEAAGVVTVAPLDLPAGAASTAELPGDGAELLKVALDGTRPQVAALLGELRPDAVIFDRLRRAPLYFNVYSAAALACVAVPARCPGGRRPSAHDLTAAPAGFPSDSPLVTLPAYQAADLTYVYESFYGMPSVYHRFSVCFEGCVATVMKSCAEMEGPYIDYFSAQIGKPLLAGPVVPEPPRGELEERWSSWLSSFPENAVVFASFGSETFPPAAAARGLLHGLEATNRPFLVVLNFPKGADAEAEIAARVPPGFEQRVKGRGVLHTGWVQQQHILQHPSVGCYVNHSGFSSVVEGLAAGCRLVLLPMKTDQYINAAVFARELHVGV
ncbi:hypothetical protein PVAP13_8KG274600 [Panicum virgatum]|uniref:Uncharacterized protein n=1 Tax=Panicum virgatum TaxID=38727 RepID=A0A8T0PI73_PANVG|nr:hypothetical protein PVAP13_8KG274600 [Panicum virgatum]